MVEIIKEVINYIANPTLLPSIIFTVIQIMKWAFIVFSSFLLIMLIFLLSRNTYLDKRYINDWSEFIKAKPYRKVKIVRDWEKIVKRAKEGDESDRKLAIIEADDTVNDILGKLGYGGSNLEHKLLNLNKDVIPNIEELKRAHKIRRDLVYDPNYTLTENESRELIEIYQKTFKDMQFI